jgi:hypothetical protein
MPDIGDLDDIAHELLEHCVDALDSIPLFDATLLGAPDHRYVAFGLPAFDCPTQLTVHVTPISEYDTTPGGLEAGKRASRGAWVNLVALVITVTRCVTTGDLSSMGTYSPPSLAALNADSKQGNHDAWALWNHLHNVKASGEFLTLCDAADFGDLLALIPSGESAGWTWTIQVVLGGYQEPIGS